MRKVLFQVHLWTGLILGLVLSVIGISGSLLVYDKELIQLGQKPLPHAGTAGTMTPADTLIAAARAAIPGKTDTVTLIFPSAPGDAAAVFLRKVRGGKEDTQHHRHSGQHREKPLSNAPRTERGPKANTYIYLDPVTAKVLEVRDVQLNPFFAFVHQLHGNLMLGRDGRAVVGWFGAAMVLLGVSGIVLWWPRRGAWKYAFGVRKKARGYLFHRDLHGAAGIWLWLVFVVVSFSGVAIAFPETVRAAGGISAPGFDPRRGPVIAVADNIEPMTTGAAIALVRHVLPAGEIATVSLANQPSEAIRVTVAGNGPAATAYIDPYAGRIAGWRNYPADFLSWQRPLHEGEGLGPVWRALVFVSGFLPLLFMITGSVMWIKKRKGKPV